MSATPDRFETAFRVGATLTASLDLEEVFATIARQVGEAMGVPWCDINEYDPLAGTMTYVAVWSPELRDEDREYVGTVVDLAERPERDAVIRKGELLATYLDDPDLDPAERDIMLAYDEHAALEVPLVFGGEPIGVLGVTDSRPGRRFSEEDKRLFRLFAQPAAIAIGNARAYRAQRERARSMAALLDSSRALTGTVELEEVLARVAQLAAEVAGVPQSAIYEYRPDTETLVYAAEYVGEPASGVALEERLGAAYALGDCPSERAVLEGSLPVEEHADDPELPAERRAVMEAYGETTCLSLPLRFGGAPVGVMRLYDVRGRRHFDAAELELVAALGELASAAISNARLFREQRDHSARLLGLFDTSRGLASTFDLATVVAHTENGARRLFGADSEVDVWLRRADGAVAPAADVLTAGEEVPGSTPAPGAAPSPGALGARALAGLSPAQEAGDRSSGLVVPLIVKGQVGGFVQVRVSGRRHFAVPEVEALLVLANQVAVAVENVRLFRRVEQQAIRDGLTGLYNHRYFQERLLQEVALAQRYDQPLSLLIIDVDEFKQFNDAFGHQRGDDALREIGSLIARSVRGGVDLPARYGGEEFAVILPHTSADAAGPPAAPGGGRPPAPADAGAVELANRLRSAIAEHAFAGHGGRRYVRLTVTAGVAMLGRPSQSASALLTDADRALYAGKGRGKNRVELSL